MKKVVITVVGKDCVGIIAKVCTYLSDNGINVLDISQTIVRGLTVLPKIFLRSQRILMKLAKRSVSSSECSMRTSLT